MNGKIAGGLHWSFWVIGAVALIWHLLGSANFLMQTKPEFVATLPDTHRAIIEGRPAWATGGFAIAVFGGAIGSILLLVKNSAAFYLFIASLLGVVLTMIHTIRIAVSVISFSPIEISVMILMPLVMVGFLVWYSKQAESRDWIG